jgi:hypothetical protein
VQWVDDKGITWEMEPLEDWSREQEKRRHNAPEVSSRHTLQVDHHDETSIITIKLGMQNSSCH